MGRGNWFPGHADTPRSLVYVDLSSDEDDARDEDGKVNYGLLAQLDDERYNDFLCAVGSLLSDSFCKTDKGDWQARLWEEAYGYHDSRMLFCNKQTAILADPEAEYHHFGIAVCPLPLWYSDYQLTKREYPLAEHNFGRTSDRLWSGLHKIGYKLRVRTSTWTSASYTPTLAPLATQHLVAVTP